MEWIHIIIHSPDIVVTKSELHISTSLGFINNLLFHYPFLCGVVFVSFCVGNG